MADVKEEIMSFLEEKGLDKRFRDNPVAVSSICDLVSEDIENDTGKSAWHMRSRRIKKIN